MHFKKPNFWDEKLNLFSYLILPFTVFIRINNFLLNQKKKLISKKIKTICVGNIYVGGTGKTPATIKIYNLIKKVSGNKRYENKLNFSSQKFGFLKYINLCDYLIFQ